MTDNGYCYVGREGYTSKSRIHSFILMKLAVLPPRCEKCLMDVLEIIQFSILIIQHPMPGSLAFINTFPVDTIDTCCRRLIPKPLITSVGL